MSDLIYDALMLGRNKLVAREEYLCAKGEKKPVEIKAQENSINFSDVMNDVTGVIHLVMQNEGYAELEVYCEDKFISFDKTVITTEEFIDGKLEFRFTVLSNKTHNGRNFAKIIFRNPVMEFAVNVTVNNQITVRYFSQNSKARIAKLCRLYLDMRTGVLFQREWQERTLEVLDEVNGSDIKELFLMLYKANVLISMEKYPEAYNLIEFVGLQLRKIKNTNWDLLCYFFYINSLYEMNDDVTKDVTVRIKQIYNDHPSWRILWILFYMDWELNNDPKEMFSMLEEEFLLRDCKSPIMYFEAVEILKKMPELISEPSNMLIKILNFAADEDILSVAMANAFNDVVWNCENMILSNRNLDACINILKYSYEKFNGKRFIRCLCKVLICAGYKDEKYHETFTAALDEFLETKDIYNYYIYTAPKDEFVKLPLSLREHFDTQEYTLNEYRAYYYACLIKKMEKYADTYERSLPGIIRFAHEALDRGLIDSSLAVIYSHLIGEDLIDHDRYMRVPEILSTREIETDNKLVVSVLVFQKEFNEFQEVMLKNGKAVIKMFVNDGVILFKDVAGNIYRNINYRSRILMPKSAFIDKCIKYAPISRYMLVGDTLERLKRDRNPKDVLDFLYKNLGTGQLRDTYEQTILQELIMEFSHDTKNEEAINRLFDFLSFNLNNQTRARLIELLIEKKRYKEAFDEIEGHGFEGVDKERIAELARVAAKATQCEEDPVMTQLAAFAFLNTTFDPQIFEYMLKNYNGEVDVLQRMYTAAKVQGGDTVMIAERLLRKMLETGTFTSNAGEIYTLYYKDGSDERLKEEFARACSDSYLYCKDERNEFIFEYIEKDILNGKMPATEVIISYLMFMRGISNMGSRSLRIVSEQLRELVSRGIMFEEFKDYRKKFAIPASLANSFIAEKIMVVNEEDNDEPLTKTTMFGKAPAITYTITTRDGKVERKDAMKEVAEGCYIKPFTLFYAESVEYRIDDGPRCLVTYNDLHVMTDASRFAGIDEMTRLLHSDKDMAIERAKEFYIKDSLIKNLF